jgi:hypothetical protein
MVLARSSIQALSVFTLCLRAWRIVMGPMLFLSGFRENFPALQANASFLEIQKRISELENQIADRREFYNDSINVFNTRIQQMPDALVARLFGMQPRLMFLVSTAKKTPMTVGFGAPQETLKS